MAGTKISELQPVTSLNDNDQIPLARGSFTRKITGKIFNDSFLSLNTRLTELSSNILYVEDSSTIDLTFNPISRVLRAEVIPGSIETIPTGAVMPFAKATSIPSGWVWCDGQIIPSSTGSITQLGQVITANFTNLYSYLGNTYGAAGKLPDLRDYFIRGYGGTNSGSLGTAQGDQFGQHTHPVTSASTGAAGNHAHTFSYTGATPDPGGGGGGGSSADPVGKSGTTNAAGTHDHTVSVTLGNTGGNETRPKNFAMLYCIKL